MRATTSGWIARGNAVGSRRYLAAVLVPWPNTRCIWCLEVFESLTRAHVIPRALMGRLVANNECGACQACVAPHEAALANDPAVIFAIQQIEPELGPVKGQLRRRHPVIADADGLLVAGKRDRRTGAITVVDTPQPDGSFVKSAARARQEVETTLRHRGASNADIAAALATLDRAPYNERVNLGLGLACRRGQTQSSAYRADLRRTSKPLRNSPASVAIAYRFLALLLGAGIYNPALDLVREEAIHGRLEQSCTTDRGGLPRGGPRPFHGIGVTGLSPVEIRICLLGDLIWDVRFPRVGLSSEPPPVFHDDLTKPSPDGAAFHQPVG